MLSLPVSQAIVALLKKRFNSEGPSVSLREPQRFFANEDWSDDNISTAKITLIPDDEGVIKIPLFTVTLYSKLKSVEAFKIMNVQIKIIEK